MTVRRFPTLRLATGITLVIGAACTAPTENCAAPANILGTWTYAAQQEGAGGVTLTGALVVAHQSCHDFDGSLDVVQADARGIQQRMSGRVTGRLLDATSLEFDAQLDVVPRQHLASLAGGGTAMTGSWLEVTDGAGLSGAFSGKRQTGAATSQLLATMGMGR